MREKVVWKFHLLYICLSLFVFLLSYLIFVHFETINSDTVANLMFPEWWGKGVSIYVPYVDNFLLREVWYISLIRLVASDWSPAAKLLLLLNINLILSVASIGILVFFILTRLGSALLSPLWWRVVVGGAVLTLLFSSPYFLRIVVHPHLRGGLELLLLMLGAFLLTKRLSGLIFTILLWGILAYSDLYYHLFILLPFLGVIFLEVFLRYRNFKGKEIAYLLAIIGSFLVGVAMHKISYLWGYKDVRHSISWISGQNIFPRLALLLESVLFINNADFLNKKVFSLFGLQGLAWLLLVVIVSIVLIGKLKGKGELNTMVRYLLGVFMSAIIVGFTSQYSDISSSRYFVASSVA